MDLEKESYHPVLNGMYIHRVQNYQAGGIFPRCPQIVDENHSQNNFPIINYKSALQNILDEHPNDNSIFSKFNKLKMWCAEILGNKQETKVSHHLQVLKASKNGKLRSVQREDVIYTEGICIKYQSRLNKGSTSLEWDSMRKGGVCPHFNFL